SMTTASSVATALSMSTASPMVPVAATSPVSALTTASTTQVPAAETERTVPSGSGGGAPWVSEVELELPPGADAEGLAHLVSVQPGRVLSPRELRRSLEQLWRTGRFSMV